jgi:hypothetical protein
MNTLYLISCSKAKGKRPGPARELYQGGLFKLSRDLVEAQRGAYLILSAKYGLLRPETVIEPYDMSVPAMTSRHRKSWAEKVFPQLWQAIAPQSHPRGLRIVFLAGFFYAQHLTRLLLEWSHEAGFRLEIELPLQGLGIGEQLGYLSSRVREVSCSRCGGAGFCDDDGPGYPFKCPRCVTVGRRS